MKVFTTIVAAFCAFLSFGAGGAAAEEVYSMAKLSICKLPNHPNDYISVTAATAFSLDGKRVAIASDERKVHVCETAGNEIRMFSIPSSIAGDDDYVNFVSLNADGSRLATASKDNVLRLWDVATGKELARLQHSGLIYMAIFSPDGSRLASTLGNNVVRIWDAATGAEIAALEHADYVRSMAFSPTGTQVAVGCNDGTVRLWETANGQKVSSLGGHSGRVYEVRFSANGQYLATASEDATARIWETARGVESLVLKHAAPVYSVEFSADGTKVITASGVQARVFDRALGAETLALKGHEADVNDASFSPDGSRIVTASGDSSLRVWNADGGSEIAVLKGHLGAANWALFTPDGGRVLSIGGPAGLAWTRLPPGELPETAAGAWFTDFGTADHPMPKEMIRPMCLSSPVAVRKDGLVVMFEGISGSEPPRAMMHLRCASESSCQVFPEMPAQGLEIMAEGTVSFTETSANICLAGECRPLTRCPEIEWTDEERGSGLAGRWEEAVLGQAR